VSPDWHLDKNGVEREQVIRLRSELGSSVPNPCIKQNHSTWWLLLTRTGFPSLLVGYEQDHNHDDSARPYRDDDSYPRGRSHPLAPRELSALRPMPNWDSGPTGRPRTH
jgi:hypothetical protein